LHPHLKISDSELRFEDVSLRLLAHRFGTPTFVYSHSAILDQVDALRSALGEIDHEICYAVKTNANLAVLGALARAGVGFDIVSVGELDRLQRIGADLSRVVFAGVGKRPDELRQAVEAGIGLLHLESVPEAELLSAIANQCGQTVRVALRVNPDLSAGGHAYISTGTAREKFGLEQARLLDSWQHIASLPGLLPVGLHCHVGSQILDIEAHRTVATRMAALTRELRNHGQRVETLNLGGGLGIRYDQETPPGAAGFAEAVLPEVRGLGVKLYVEPGRFLVGNAGVLLSRVLYRKETSHKTFIVLDAGMNDLVRPSLYGAHHDILPLRQQGHPEWETVDVVGPICESGDFLARSRLLPHLECGDLVAICSAGAYGFTMSSNYNSRPRAAEVLLRDQRFRLVRERESLDDLVRGEREWPEVAESAPAGRESDSP
jgi:diaminopimelate decarboxylase